MKTIVNLTTTILFTIIISAHAEPYYGINIGGNLTTIEKNLSYLGTENNISSYYNGLRTQILAGYNFHLFNGRKFNYYNEQSFQNKFYFSIEVDGNYNSNKSSSNINPWFLTTDASASEEQNYGYDLFILAKYNYPQNIVWFFGELQSNVVYAT